MVDVGFGGDGATGPRPLVHAEISRNIGSQEMRLMHEYMDAQTVRDDEKQKMWVYQYRNSPEMAWTAFYAFTETEFLDQDLRVMNHFTALTSFQPVTVLAVKFLRRVEQDDAGKAVTDKDGKVERIHGKVMLVQGVFKINDGGKTRVVEDCKNEDDRIKALEKWFGLRLTEQQRNGMRGYCTELTS